MKKRILPALLALALVLGLLPLAVFAVDPTTVDTTVPENTAQVSAWPSQTDSNVTVTTENDVTTYKLSNDITLAANLTVGSGAKKVLDLNGHTLYCTKANNNYLYVQVGAGGDLKVCDTGATKGKFVTQDVGINVNGAGSKLVVDGITMDVNSGDSKVGHYGIQLNSDLTASSSVEIKNSTITGKGIYACAFNVNGKLAAKVPVTITNSHLISEADNAMYMAGAAQVTIENSEIKGTSAIYQKSGKLTIRGTTQIIGTSEPKTYTHNGNGSDPTGDALVVETCGYPGGAPELDIQGGTFTIKEGTKTKAVIVYRWDKAPSDQQDPEKFITGGTFSTEVDSKYLADGKACTQNSTTQKWEVVDAESLPIAVAKDNGVFIVSDQASYNKLPESYRNTYSWEDYQASLTPTLPWLVAVYNRQSASQLTYVVTKDGQPVTLANGENTSVAGTNADAYIMWRIKDTTEGLKQTDPYGTYTVSVKLDSEVVKLGEVTYSAGDITGSVEGSGDNAVLKPIDSAVAGAVASQVDDTTATEVNINVVAGATDAPAVEVPLNTATLEKLESVAKPVVIETPQGGVKAPANVLVSKTGKTEAVDFVMKNTTTSEQTSAGNVETYAVGFYKTNDTSKANEIEVKNVPITLTFKTSFSAGDKVDIQSGGTLVQSGVIVAADKTVTIQTTHLSNWTLRKVAGVTVGYYTFGDTGSDPLAYHLTPGYVKIALGQTTYGEVKKDDYYLVQIVNGATVLTIIKAGANGLVIPCNKSGLLSVWQLGSSEPDITTIKGSTLVNKQVIANPALNIATLTSQAHTTP